MTEKQWALALSMVRAAEEQGSWCGDTHIQKSMYFLQELVDGPAGFPFVLYKHGPFSFDLRRVIGLLRGIEFIVVRSRGSCGVSMQVGDLPPVFEQMVDDVMQKFGDKLRFIAEHLSVKSVSELEILATALWIKGEEPTRELTHNVEKLTDLKPHFSPEQAKQAFRELCDLQDLAVECGVLSV